MMRLQGVLFDLDGTLADTVPVCIAAFRRAIAHFTSHPFSDDDIKAMFGPSEEGIIRRLLPQHREACLELYLHAYEEEHQRCAAPFPGIAEALAELKRQGIHLGVVTGKGPRSATISLRSVGLLGFFDPIEVGSPRGNIKPQAIADALARWQLAPSAAAYVGDAPSDIVDARSVGVAALAAAWAPGAPEDALTAAHPDALLRTTAELASWIGARAR